MCGIAGILIDEPGSAEHAGRVAATMADALRHRGPDGLGVAACASGASRAVAFGHTRLAILDLSERAAQPMASADQRVWITFNGEIYNFRELRRDLEARGRVFRSDSDTEVILQGYEEWGEAVVDRLRGMFAFGIWDDRAGRLLLVRDRLGIKPLYVARRGRALVFASELRALLASGLVERRLDPVALDEFLAYQAVPAPRTLVRDVELLDPGTVYRVGSGLAIARRRYWDLLDSADARARGDAAGEARERVAALLADATRHHLVSDVPVGVFLSGGIDSSAIAALVARTGAAPHTYTIALPGTAQDEAAFAREMATRVGAVHTEVDLDVAAFRGSLPAALAAVDHPSGDGLNSYVVSQAVRASGLKVALSGLGGDELFGGYPSFARLERFARVAPALARAPSSLRAAAAATVRALGRHSVGSSKAAAVLEGDVHLAHAFPVTRQMFSPEERRRLLAPDTRGRDESPDPYVALIEQAMAAHPHADVMTLVSYAEARTYMHDVLLRDTDQMSMAHGLEVRVPLLDHELVEYVMGLAADVKRPGSTPKRLLVESLGGALPDACVHRPKQGFVLPFDRWMRSDLREFCEHHLGPAGLAARAGFQPAALDDLWQRFVAGHPGTSWSRPWTLVSLDAWLERQGVAL